jgi:hypothetical protein
MMFSMSRSLIRCWVKLDCTSKNKTERTHAEKNVAFDRFSTVSSENVSSV